MDTIKVLATQAGITLRALRHYDNIGLLVPSGRSDAGYRLYSHEDAIKLQRILFYRELGFPLEKISQALHSADSMTESSLLKQAEALERQAERFLELAQTARKTAAHLKGELEMENKELFKGFDYEKMLEEQKQYEPEVIERWGDTDAYKISAKRTKSYTKQDWERISAESEAAMQALVACYKDGVATDDPKMMEVCNIQRGLITKNFYPCSVEIYSGLGQMYIADERFTATYEKYAQGLAEYYSKAIEHYCKQAADK